ncbi:putative secreted protein [Candidatus Phytoplasma solani]
MKIIFLILIFLIKKIKPLYILYKFFEGVLNKIKKVMFYFYLKINYKSV